MPFNSIVVAASGRRFSKASAWRGCGLSYRSVCMSTVLYLAQWRCRRFRRFGCSQHRTAQCDRWHVQWILNMAHLPHGGESFPGICSPRASRRHPDGTLVDRLHGSAANRRKADNLWSYPPPRASAATLALFWNHSIPRIVLSRVIMAFQPHSQNDVLRQPD